jgi:hypothetical protein
MLNVFRFYICFHPLANLAKLLHKGDFRDGL